MLLRPRMWQSCRVDALRANGPPVLLVSCQILQSWTVRPPVLSAFVRHDLLLMFVGTYKRAPPRWDHPDTSDMGTTWCSHRKVGSKVCVIFVALSVVVTVCDL